MIQAVMGNPLRNLHNRSRAWFVAALARIAELPLTPPPRLTYEAIVARLNRCTTVLSLEMPTLSCMLGLANINIILRGRRGSSHDVPDIQRSELDIFLGCP